MNRGMALKRNVLIFHSGALGDFVLSWPLAMAAGRLFAQSRVFYVTSKQKGLLAEKALRLESIDAENGWHTLFADSPKLSDVPARLLAGAHTVVSFVAEPGSTWEANVRTASAGADVLCLAAHPPADFAGHHTDYLLQQLSPSMVWHQGVSQMLASLAARGLGHTPPGDGPVIIHPGSGSPDKCWPTERFIELAGNIATSGRGVKFVLGEVEQDRWPAADIARLQSAAPVEVLMSLVDLYDRLRQASAFVGNDSGPGHLAGIMGVPTVSIFGPTDPARWKPIGPRVTIVQGNAVGSISVEDVLESIDTQRRVGFSPPHRA